MARDPLSLFKPSGATRRGFLLSSAAVAAGSLVGCGGGDDEPVVSFGPIPKLAQMAVWDGVLGY